VQEIQLLAGHVKLHAITRLLEYVGNERGSDELDAEKGRGKAQVSEQRSEGLE
jgi:hypothetical protein